MADDFSETQLLLACESDRSRQKLLADLFMRHRQRLRFMVQLRLDKRLQGRLDPSDVVQEAYVLNSDSFLDLAVADTSDPVCGVTVFLNATPPPASRDCNANDVPDECDISGSTSPDCDSDGTPDECQLAGNDCNQNGIPDVCDISQARSFDRNGNAVPDECEPVLFRRGDCDGDGQVTGVVTDAIFLLTFNFLGGPVPSCLAACDVNGDGEVRGIVTDAIFLLTFNFLGGLPPATPFPECGAGSAADGELGCGTPAKSCNPGA